MEEKYNYTDKKIEQAMVGLKAAAFDVTVVINEDISKLKAEIQEKIDQGQEVNSEQPELVAVGQYYNILEQFTSYIGTSEKIAQQYDSIHSQNNLVADGEKEVVAEEVPVIEQPVVEAAPVVETPAAEVELPKVEEAPVVEQPVVEATSVVEAPAAEVELPKVEEAPAAVEATPVVNEVRAIRVGENQFAKLLQSEAEQAKLLDTVESIKPASMETTVSNEAPVELPKAEETANNDFASMMNEFMELSKQENKNIEQAALNVEDKGKQLLKEAA